MRAPGEIRAAAQDGELLAAEPRQHVLRAQQAAHHLRQLREHEVPGRVAVRVVDLLEEVDVQEDQRQRAAVARREREFLLQVVGEVLLVEDLGQPVAQRRFVHLALEHLVQIVVVRELQDRRRADHDLVAVGQLALVDLDAVAERAVRRAHVLDQHLVAVANERAVLARHAFVVQPHADVGPAPDHRLVLLQLEHLARADACQHHQIREVAFLFLVGLGRNSRLGCCLVFLVPADAHARVHLIGTSLLPPSRMPHDYFTAREAQRRRSRRPVAPSTRQRSSPGFRRAFWQSDAQRLGLAQRRIARAPGERGGERRKDGLVRDQRHTILAGGGAQEGDHLRDRRPREPTGRWPSRAGDT